MKDDERALLDAIQDATWKAKSGHPIPREIADRLGMNSNRADYIFNKWLDKGWLECGVSAGTGWLTEKGMEQ